MQPEINKKGTKEKKINNKPETRLKKNNQKKKKKKKKASQNIVLHASIKKLVRNMKIHTKRKMIGCQGLEYHGNGKHLTNEYRIYFQVI